IANTYELGITQIFVFISKDKIRLSGGLSLYPANRKKSGDCAWNPKQTTRSKTSREAADRHETEATPRALAAMELAGVVGGIAVSEIAVTKPTDCASTNL